jgi:hypothetical protein
MPWADMHVVYTLTLSLTKVFKDKHPPLTKRKGSRELEQSHAQIMKIRQRIVCGM